MYYYFNPSRQRQWQKPKDRYVLQLKNPASQKWILSHQLTSDSGNAGRFFGQVSFRVSISDSSEPLIQW